LGKRRCERALAIWVATIGAFFDQSEGSIWRWRLTFSTNQSRGKWVGSVKAHLSGNIVREEASKVPAASNSGGDKSSQIKRNSEEKWDKDSLIAAFLG
jgi:hypothetical protein